MSLLPAVPPAPVLLTPRGLPACPDWKARLVAATLYFGLAPVLQPFRFRRSDPFVQHHIAQALATILAFLAVLLGYGLYWLVLSYMLVFQRDLYERLPTLGEWDAPVRDVLLTAPVFLVWLVAWLGGLLAALFGSQRTLPLIGRLARKPPLLPLAFAGNASLLAAAALVSALALHASSLTRDDDKPAAAYLLYDNMGFVPCWVMSLGFYRISLAAQARWGPDSVIVAPLDERHLRLALRHGRFVFLACHGQAGEIVTPEFLISPPPLVKEGDTAVRGLWIAKVDSRYEEWKVLEVGDNLRFVYNTACDSGSKAEEWEQALAPARVRTFNRLSAVAEHLVWLWSDGPWFVREMQ